MNDEIHDLNFVFKNKKRYQCNVLFLSAAGNNFFVDFFLVYQLERDGLGSILIRNHTS
jgi:hypothetical protein